MPPKHILGNFDAALDQLQGDVTHMAGVAAQNLANAVQGLVEASPDLCNKAIADDEEVDGLEKRIDKEGMDIIMKFSPVASDLRRVISTMKMATSLERISDHAVSIAKRARRMERHLPEFADVAPLHAGVSGLLKDAVHSFTEEDVNQALSIKPRERKLEEDQRAVIQKLTERMEADPRNIKAYVELVLIVRFLKRTGDQACNIAEDAVYLVSAQDIRHGGTLNQQ
jgi:phosphate transport system protein